MLIQSLSILFLFPVLAWSFDISEVVKEIGDLDLQKCPVYSSHINDYFRFYSLNFTDPVKHYFGYVKSDSFRIATHVFIPPASQGSVLMTHGFFDHSGILKNLIKLCLDLDYTVVCFDLPGHGLSSGVRASIDNFSEYGRALASVRKKAESVIDSSLIITAHSTGCAAAFEYLTLPDRAAVKKMIMISPLVKMAWYFPARAGLVILSPFTQRSMRLYRNQSSDKEFLHFLKNDPMRIDHFPFRWARSYFSWFDKTRSWEIRKEPEICVIQGTKDDVVNWRYNIDFLKSKFTDISIHLIKGARHQGMNEAGVFKEEFEKIFRNELKKVSISHPHS
ncbi:MAG: alpha/beta hydrolase [Fibrobacter sp.]|nr:alpha/beta hydrolase [Fibrobacter sp.]